jgi:transcriptional regulator with XRE-family HTH domain
VNLDELLGINHEDPDQMLAERLVQADDRFLDDLIKQRMACGLEVEQVAERIGVSASTIRRMETGDRDPRLSLLRLYALAVGAEVRHPVTPYRHNELAAAQVNERLIESKSGLWADVKHHASHLSGHPMWALVADGHRG